MMLFVHPQACLRSLKEPEKASTHTLSLMSYRTFSPQDVRLTVKQDFRYHSPVSISYICYMIVSTFLSPETMPWQRDEDRLSSKWTAVLVSVSMTTQFSSSHVSMNVEDKRASRLVSQRRYKLPDPKMGRTWSEKRDGSLVSFQNQKASVTNPIIEKWRETLCLVMSTHMQYIRARAAGTLQRQICSVPST